MSKVAIVTGATRNLGFFLAQGLAQRLAEGDVVYLTGRDPQRVIDAVGRLAKPRARVIGEALDVADPEAIRRLAGAIADRHGGIDIVFSNHYARVQPDEPPAAMIEAYVAANNLGTTELLRQFSPLLRDGSRLLVVASRAGSLRALAPALHPRFTDLATLEDVDSAVCAWRDAVRDGRAAGQAWPAWINIPSKIGQVAAVRVLAAQRRTGDLARNILIASIAPGLIDTGAARPWLDMTNALPADRAAEPLLDLALDPAPDPAHYGELINVAPAETGGPRKPVLWL